MIQVTMTNAQAVCLFSLCLMVVRDIHKFWLFLCPCSPVKVVFVVMVMVIVTVICALTVAVAVVVVVMIQ